MRSLIALLILFAALAAGATTPEQAYLAARDQAIAALKKTPEAKQDAEERRLRARLEQQLKSLVNPPQLDGFPGPATMSPETLLDHDEGFGALDGISRRGKDPTSRVLVTTDGLLRSWLKEHKTFWEGDANPPTEPEAAFRSEVFYTQAVNDDAAFSIFADLPIRKPDGAASAVALLVAESQDVAVEPPGEIAVALSKGGKVFIAVVTAKAKPTPIAACDAIWKAFEAKSAAPSDSAQKDDKGAAESIDPSEQAAAAVHKCWFEKASGAPEFPALTEQAQRLIDGFAAR